MQLVPLNRPKTEDRSARPRTRPTALHELSTDRQFDREERRQDLLDRRWRRWQSIVFTVTISTRTLILRLTVCLGVLTGAIPIHRLVDCLLSIG